jgi:hypothetical protein
MKTEENVGQISLYILDNKACQSRQATLPYNKTTSKFQSITTIVCFWLIPHDVKDQPGPQF